MSDGSHAITGLDRVLRRPELLSAPQPGLLTNYAATASDLRRGVDALVAAGITPRCLIAPEHGYWGTAQAGEGGEDTRDPATGIPVVSSYRVCGDDLVALLRTSGIRSLVVDLQDIGARFYTYLWSMYDAMQACAVLGLPVIVLDRPAPLPAEAAGPGLDPALSSFVGRVSIPLRHGARLGDLARHLAEHHLEAHLELTVITAPAADGEAPFVPTSPNMPTPATVALYPATGLLEGTTWCEGRGTTLPFELFGAPWSGPELAGALRERAAAGLLPGVAVREAVFTPAHGVFSGQRVHGAQLHLIADPARTVRELLDPLRLAHTLLGVLRDQHPAGHELWRRNGPERPPFIDLLWGSTALREGIDDGAGLEEILAASPVAPRIPRAAGAAPTGEGA